jgi:hypothetical protein
MQAYRMIIAVAALLFPLSSQAQDSVLHLNFQSVVDAAIADGQLDGTVKFYLRGQKTGAVNGREFVSNKRTNKKIYKTDEEGCAWNLRFVLMSFQTAAKIDGANAIIDLVSYYKKNEYESAALVECHAGAMMSGVAMKGKAAFVR